VQQAIEISFVFSNLAKTVFPSAVPVKQIHSSQITIAIRT
jgi:hypothetical protein